MSEYYILDGKIPKQVDTVMEWASHFEKMERHVAETNIGDVYVSTVFLGLNHALRDDVPPVLFETMIFGGEHDQYQKRYSTWDEAESGHHEACALVVSYVMLKKYFN